MSPAALALAVLLLAPPASASEAWLTSLKEAQETAVKEGKPILAEFSAVWCYSCYYMEGRVLSRDAFARAARGLVLLKLDVDKPEGLELKRARGVSFLPSFLVLDPSGTERGRIVGEQTEKDFLAQLAKLAGSGGDRERERLKTAMESGDLESARRLRSAIEAKVGELADDPDWRLTSARLDLRGALAKKDGPAAASALENILSLEKGCALAYDVLGAAEALAVLEPDEARSAWEGARRALEDLAEKGAFGKEEERCADLRSPLEALADVYVRLGEKEKRESLLARAIALLAGLSAQAGVGADRNLDDNLRWFLELAGRDKELSEVYPKLLAAYPADYVYPYRYAKYLRGRKNPARALALAEKAYGLSYGANRFQAARLRGDLLADLGRRAEAAALWSQEIKANKTRFPAEAAGLERRLKELGL